MKSSRITKPTTPDLLILTLLNEKPMHGYEILQELVLINAADWIEISQPQVYYSLEKLSKQKWIIAVASKSRSGGPVRQTFKTSAKGLKKMSTALKSSSWAEERVPSLFQTWLGLSARLSKADQLKMINARKSFLETQVEKEKKDLENMRARNHGDYMGEEAIGYIISQFKLECDWLLKLGAKIEKFGRKKN